MVNTEREPIMRVWRLYPPAGSRGRAPGQEVRGKANLPPFLRARRCAYIF